MRNASAEVHVSSVIEIVGVRGRATCWVGCTPGGMYRNIWRRNPCNEYIERRSTGRVHIYDSRIHSTEAWRARMVVVSQSSSGECVPL